MCKIKSADDIGVAVAHPNSYPQYFPAARIHTTIYCNWKSTVLVSHQFIVTITQNNETAKENWNQPRTTTNMALHECSRLSHNFSEKFLHPLLPSWPLEKFRRNTKRTFYKIPCLETLWSFGHHMSKYQLLYLPFPISNLSLKILANNVLLRTKMATLGSPLPLNNQEN